MEDLNLRREILAHEPVPGYRRFFLIVLALSAVYLCIILASTL